MQSIIQERVPRQFQYHRVKIVSSLLTRKTESLWQKSEPPCKRNPHGTLEFGLVKQITSIVFCCYVEAASQCDSMCVSVTEVIAQLKNQQ